MKYIIILSIFVLFKSIQLNAQTDTIKNGTTAYQMRPDTILERDSFGVVYISTDTTNEIYDYLAFCPNEEYIKSNYGEDIRSLRNYFNITPIKNENSKLPKIWNPVYSINDKYYLYYPSNWDTYYSFYLTDTIIYKVQSNTNNFYLYSERKKSEENKIEFRTISFFNKPLIGKLKIELLNEELGIYKWTFSKGKKTIESRLMQDSKFIKNLPVIVRDCFDKTCPTEFDLKNIKI